MPKPIVCLSEQLRQYLEDFRPCFSKRQWKYFVTVLLGLIECEERKTMTAILRVVGEQISLSGFSRFMSKWPWSEEEVVQTWSHRFRQRLEPQVQAEHKRLKSERSKSAGRPKATVVTGYLSLDDSIHINTFDNRRNKRPKRSSKVSLGHYLVEVQATRLFLYSCAVEEINIFSPRCHDVRVGRVC